MVTAAIVICVRPRATSTRPHQGRSSNPLNNIGILSRLWIGYMGAGAANSTGKRQLSRVNLCVLRPRQPNLPLRIGNFDSAGAEFRQQLDTYVRAHVLTATLRI